MILIEKPKDGPRKKKRVNQFLRNDMQKKRVLMFKKKETDDAK